MCQRWLGWYCRGEHYPVYNNMPYFVMLLERNTKPAKFYFCQKAGYLSGHRQVLA